MENNNFNHNINNQHPLPVENGTTSQQAPSSPDLFDNELHISVEEGTAETTHNSPHPKASPGKKESDKKRKETKKREASENKKTHPIKLDYKELEPLFINTYHNELQIILRKHDLSIYDLIRMDNIQQTKSITTNDFLYLKTNIPIIIEDVINQKTNYELVCGIRWLELYRSLQNYGLIKKSESFMVALINKNTPKEAIKEIIKTSLKKEVKERMYEVPHRSRLRKKLSELLDQLT